MPSRPDRLVPRPRPGVVHRLWRAARDGVPLGALAASMGLSAGPAAAAPLFGITSVAEGCVARFLNDKAQTVVVCDQEYLWSPDAPMQPIADPRFPNEWMTTHALNNHGVVTGILQPRFGPPPDHPMQSFVGPAGGPMERIGHGDHHILAFGLNDAGVVVGQAWTEVGGEVISRGFRRGPGGEPELSMGDRESHANDINERGEIVGTRYGANALGRAVKRGVDGRVRPLVRTLSRSYAPALNDRGDAAGHVDVDGQSVRRAFVAWGDGPPVLIDRGTDPQRSSAALGLNDQRQVVGEIKPAPDRASVLFYWDEQLPEPVHLISLLDPNDPLRPRIVGLGLPVAINNAGQVLANAWDANGERLPVLLTPHAGR